ncbi:hypothetical protein [Chania multitudinisentens]|uniref:hypothetical protein n=1 Tax=Chania multitudinisentens TaxID=1639108 RepID=UPI0003E1351B
MKQAISIPLGFHGIELIDITSSLRLSVKLAIRLITLANVVTGDRLAGFAGQLNNAETPVYAGVVAEFYKRVLHLSFLSY